MLLVLAATACSTKKDAFVNRNWHALNTKFNVLYNGQVALEEGRKSLIETYVDNYWEILPVERMEIRDEIIIDTAQLNPNFQRAEEKATKAIQKRGMNIRGRERNAQIDDAYLLLGKARYYDQRFVPAMEAFNYVLRKYTDADVVHQAAIWREKANIRMENEEVAIINLKKVLASAINKQEYADASAMMAQAYINLEQKDSAIFRLKVASNTTKNFEEKGRYNYIIGQLYNEMGLPDSANIAFDKVIALKRKSPRIYMMNAYVEKIKNQFQKGDQDEELMTLLEKLEKNRENRPYLDKLYRLNAMYYLKNDSVELAQLYLDKSLRNTTTDNTLKAMNYEDLGVMYFDKAEYKLASAYYDSTLTYLDENTAKYRGLARKRENLQNVIKYEDIAQRNDSILYVVNLSDIEKEAYYQKHIDSLKEIEEEERERAKIALLAQNRRGSSLGSLQSNSDSEFYFYNTTSVQYGVQEFKKRWGNRSLEDNWRLNNKTVVSREEEELAETETASSSDSPDFYISQLPTEAKAIDSIHKERNFANYQLGLIYKERFQENRLAAHKLETLLNNNPEEKLVLPAKYNLYKIYEALELPMAQQLKTDIISSFPDSRYAEILKNPEAVLSDDGNSPETVYANLYKDFEDQNYEKVITEADEHISTYNGEDIMMKFEMLKATATGRLIGFEAYKEALSQIALKYPNAEEGERAQEIIDKTLPRMASKSFDEDDSSTVWKVVYPFQQTDTTGIRTLEEKVDQSIEELKYLYLSHSKDIYDRDKLFFVIHGFDSKQKAEGYAELLNINKDYLVDNEKFVISSSDYKTIQIHKNLDEYLTEDQFINPSLNN
ncbi:hypothetical protein OOZ15_14610 [Galbibacter sp. EGI 63066]|nr:hypothetical protein [Galbibacter sp. EGI 63066]